MGKISYEPSLVKIYSAIVSLGERNGSLPGDIIKQILKRSLMSLQQKKQVAQRIVRKLRFGVNEELFACTNGRYSIRPNTKLRLDETDGKCKRPRLAKKKLRPKKAFTCHCNRYSSVCTALSRFGGVPVTSLKTTKTKRKGKKPCNRRLKKVRGKSKRRAGGQGRVKVMRVGRPTLSDAQHCRRSKRIKARSSVRRKTGRNEPTPAKKARMSRRKDNEVVVPKRQPETEKPAAPENTRQDNQSSGNGKAESEKPSQEWKDESTGRSQCCCRPRCKVHCRKRSNHGDSESDDEADGTVTETGTACKKSRPDPKEKSIPVTKPPTQPPYVSTQPLMMSAHQPHSFDVPINTSLFNHTTYSLSPSSFQSSQSPGQPRFSPYTVSTNQITELDRPLSPLSVPSNHSTSFDEAIKSSLFNQNTFGSSLYSLQSPVGIARRYRAIPLPMSSSGKSESDLLATSPESAPDPPNCGTCGPATRGRSNKSLLSSLGIDNLVSVVTSPFKKRYRTARQDNAFDGPSTSRWVEPNVADQGPKVPDSDEVDSDSSGGSPKTRSRTRVVGRQLQKLDSDDESDSDYRCSVGDAGSEQESSETDTSADEDGPSKGRQMDSEGSDVQATPANSSDDDEESVWTPGATGGHRAAIADRGRCSDSDSEYSIPDEIDQGYIADRLAEDCGGPCKLPRNLGVVKPCRGAKTTKRKGEKKEKKRE